MRQEDKEKIEYIVNNYSPHEILTVLGAYYKQEADNYSDMLLKENARKYADISDQLYEFASAITY
jgi:hypothetical protein